MDHGDSLSPTLPGHGSLLRSFLHFMYLFLLSDKTEDGYETALQVNYLSAFLMTAKLLPVLKASGDDCRILMMCSEAYNMAAFDLGSYSPTILKNNLCLFLQDL